LGDGRYALYAHLKPGSITVQAGEQASAGRMPICGRAASGFSATSPSGPGAELTRSLPMLTGTRSRSCSTWPERRRHPTQEARTLQPEGFSTGWPTIGTTLLVFPLNDVCSRFQIMRLFPGYRNHFSQVAALSFVRRRPQSVLKSDEASPCNLRPSNDP
jgi:hypothetical protein